MLLAPLVCDSGQAQDAPKENAALPPGAIARLGALQFRHTTGIADLHFTPDGKAIVFRERDSLCFRDTATWKEIRRHKGLSLLAFAPDPSTMIARSDAGEILVVETTTGKALKMVWAPPATKPGRGRRNWFGCSRDCRYLAIAMLEYHNAFGQPVEPNVSTLEVWDIAAGKRVRQFQGVQFDRGNTDSPVFSADNRSLCDGTALWEVASGRQRVVLPPGRDHGAVPSPDGKQLAYSTGEKVVLVDAMTGKDRALEIKGVQGLAFAPDSGVLYMAGVGIRRWDVAAGKELPALGAAGGRIGPMALSPDGKTLAAVEGYVLGMWETTTGKALHDTAGHAVTINALALSPDGKSLATVSHDTRLCLWDTVTWKQTQQMVLSHPTAKPWQYGVGCVRFSSDGKYIAAGGHGRVAVLELATGKIVRELVPRPNEMVWSVAFSPDGKTLSAVQVFGIYRWDMGTGKQLARHDRHESIALAPDGETFAACDFAGKGDTKSIRLGNLDTGKTTREWGVPGSPSLSVRFSSDGKSLISISQDSAAKATIVHFWDPATGKELRQMKLRDGNNPRRAWDLDRARMLFLPANHSAQLAIFTTDGKTLISANPDGTLLVWDPTALKPE